MSDKKKDAETINPWITPAVITAVVGLIGTLLTLYFSYLKDTRPLELAATQTADARIYELTLAGIKPTQNTPTATFAPPTATSAPTATPHTPTLTPTRTLAPSELKFCIDPRSIYVRAGPGTDFGAVGSLTFEDCLYLDGQNPDGSWLRISPDQGGKYQPLGGDWIRSDLVRPQDFSQLPIIQPPTSTPTPEG